MAGRAAFPGGLPWAVSTQHPLRCPVQHPGKTGTQAGTGTETGQLPTSGKNNRAALQYSGPLAYQQELQCSSERLMADGGQEGPYGSLLRDGSDRQSMPAFLCGGSTSSCVLSGPRGWRWARWHTRAHPLCRPIAPLHGLLLQLQRRGLSKGQHRS